MNSSSSSDSLEETDRLSKRRELIKSIHLQEENPTRDQVDTLIHSFKESIDECSDVNDYKYAVELISQINDVSDYILTSLEERDLINYVMKQLRLIG